MPPEETAPTTDVVAQAMNVLAEHNAEHPDEGSEGEAPEAVEAEGAEAPAEPSEPAEPGPPSKAEEIRRIARERAAKLEEAEAARRQPQAPQDPLASFQREEIQRAVEFQRLFQRDPIAAAKAAGMDVSQLYDRMTREALTPGATQQMSAVEQAEAKARAAEEKAEAVAQQFQQWQQQQEAQARYNAYVAEINKAASDTKAYPLTSRLDEATRVRWAAEEERDMLRMGYQPSPLELVELVEERASNLQRQLVGGKTEEAGARSGGTPKAGKSAGAATTRSSQSLTNDLASQSGPPAEVDYSPEAALKRAEMAARELWTSSE